ncbi:cation:proton antiporter [Fontibacter flavus]|uniref:Cation:proton antiporter n=1 Tax=Fontibacter flavus TaxID=654838 RepID=A0ABV6FMJ1_9BACT
MTCLNELSTSPFMEFAIILFFAALLGIIGQLLKQPLIVMFIFLGVLVGPSFLDIVQSKEQIHLLADIGIAILLFIVGLKLDLRLIKSIGKIALMTGIGQVIFTSLFGYVIGIALGFSSMESFYIAVALTFSSTIIIVKLLSDKKEIDSLHGQIAVGFLIVQDLVVILVMIILSTLNRAGDSLIGVEIGLTLIYTMIFVGFTFLAMRYFVPGITLFLARSIELLTLFGIAWAVAMAAISELIGFSAEVGAFLAGVTLASSPYKDVISSRLVSLRDFLLLFFFVNLGSNLNLSLIGEQIPSSIIFSLFVLIGNPLIVLVIMGIMGYRKRTSFLAGLTVAQISEFSLIFAGLGLAVGHINEEVLGLITLVGLITIALSTYMILYSYPLYDFLAPILGVFEKRHIKEGKDRMARDQNPFEIVVIGLGRFGTEIIKRIEEKSSAKYFGVDFDPQVVREFQEQNKSVIYGDLEDPELLDRIPLQHVKCIINTVPNAEFAVHLVKRLGRLGFKGSIYHTALQKIDQYLLKEEGIEGIVIPYQLAATNFFNDYLNPVLQKNQ